MSNVTIYLSRENQKQFQAGFTYFPLLRACPKSPQYKLQIVLCLHHVLAACVQMEYPCCTVSRTFSFTLQESPHFLSVYRLLVDFCDLLNCSFWSQLGRVLIRACGVNDLNQQGQNSV